MDEYRPYPAQQPSDDTDTESDSSAAANGPRAQAPDEAASGEAAGPVDYAVRPASGVRGSRNSGDEDGYEQDDSEREEVDGNERRPDRPAPNLDHPGGHLPGTVARLNRPRRFGFLRTEDGMEIFFHASALEAGPSAFDALRGGQAVEFDCHQDEQGRGLAATLVQVVGPPPADSQPRPARPSREERRANRERERGDRGERERGQRDIWRVFVLRDDEDAPLATQIEKLLNERSVKPGQFSLTFLDRDGETECWVALHTG